MEWCVESGEFVPVQADDNISWCAEVKNLKSPLATQFAVHNGYRADF